MSATALRVAPALQGVNYIVPLDEATLPHLVGGKAHNLYRASQLGLRVPSGFVVTARAFEAHLEENDLAVRIRALTQRKRSAAATAAAKRASRPERSSSDIAGW